MNFQWLEKSSTWSFNDEDRKFSGRFLFLKIIIQILIHFIIAVWLDFLFSKINFWINRRYNQFVEDEKYQEKTNDIPDMKSGTENIKL